MTIKLLAPYGRAPVGAIIALDAATETSLVAAKVATTTLTGGTAWVDPYAAPSPAGSVSSTALRKWNAALAKARAGVRNARLLLGGDSTEAGSGSNSPPAVGFAAGGQAYCPAEKMAAKFRALGQPATTNAILGNIGTGTMAALRAWDARITGTGFAFTTNVGDAFIGPFLESTNGNTLIFTPAGNVDTFEIYAGLAVGSRIFNYKVDAGAATDFDANGVSNGLSKIVVPAGAAGAHSLTITKGAGGGNYVFAVLAYNSAATGIQVIPMAVSGTRVQQLATDTAQNSGLAVLNTLAPDLTVWNQSINDWKNGGDLAGFIANLTKVIKKAQLTGDFLGLTGNPTGLIGNAPYDVQQTYVDAVINTCIANGAAYVDTWRLFGSGAYENDSSIYADETHPNSVGYDMEYDRVVRAVLGLR